MPERDVNPMAERDEGYEPAPLVRDEHGESTMTRVIEQQTARIPSHWFLVAAMASMILSLTLEIAGRHRGSRFVGMWTSVLLITGVYNKLVKSVGPR